MALVIKRQKAGDRARSGDVWARLWEMAMRGLKLWQQDYATTPKRTREGGQARLRGWEVRSIHPKPG